MRASMARKMSPRPFSSIDVSQSPRPKPLNAIPAAGRLIGPDRSSLSTTLHTAFKPDSSSGASRLTLMRRLSCVGSVLLAILIDPGFSTSLPTAFKPDSSTGTGRLTWIRPSSSLEMHWRSFPLTISIDPRLSTTLPATFEKVSISTVYHQTSMRSLGFIHSSLKYLMLSLVPVFSFMLQSHGLFPLSR